MFEKFIIYAEKNEDNPGYRYELGQYGFMDNTLKDVLSGSGSLSFYVILTSYEKRKRIDRFSTTIYFYNGDDCLFLEGTSSKKIVYEVYEDEDCNKLIESRTISGEEFAELAKEIIRTKKNAYESVRRPRGRVLKEGGLLGDYWCPDPDYEDPYVNAYGHEYECVACGRVFRGIEGVCKNDIGRIFCKDCWDKLYGDKEKNESRRPRGKMLNEEGMDYDIYVVPEWTLPYLFNDDPSGLEDDEIEAVDKFVESLPSGLFDVPEDEEGNTITFFAHYNDLPGEQGRLGNTCVELKVVRE